MRKAHGSECGSSGRTYSSMHCDIHVFWCVAWFDIYMLHISVEASVRFEVAKYIVADECPIQD